LVFGRAIERGFGNSITFVSSLVMLYVASRVGTELSYAKIFSALEIVVCFKFYTFATVLSVGLFYEIKIVLQRFATIFNLENKSMILIDRASKIPVS
jgi:hypothetical protein